MNKRNLIPSLIALTLILALASCSTLGRANLDKARGALGGDEPVAALVYAAEALLEDPKFSGAKIFLRDNTEAVLGKTASYLVSTEKSSVAADLERRFDTYTNLVAFYEKLAKVGMPIAEGQQLFGLIKGWEWSTPIMDYKPQAENSRASARAGFYKAGLEEIKKGELDSADALLSKVIGKFAIADSAEQAADRERIAKDFAAWAATKRRSPDPSELAKGIRAYELALKAKPGDAPAADGLKAMKLELSDAYVAIALKKEKEGGIDALKEAISLFKSALKHNSANAKAAEGVSRSQRQIAALFCDRGEKLEKSGQIEDMIAADESYAEALKWDGASARATGLKAAVAEKLAAAYYREAARYAADSKSDDSIAKAIAAYDGALKWVPGYKDAELSKKRLFVSRELLVLEGKLAETQTEFDRTQKRIGSLADQVAKANKGMDDLNYVADAVVQLDEQLLVLSKTASALSGIPVVGSVVSVLGTGLGMVQKPVDAVSDKIKRVRAPFIAPAREMMASVGSNIGKVVAAMESTRTNIDYTRKVAVKLNACLAKVADGGAVQEIEKNVKKINEILGDLNKGLASVNSVQDKTEGTLTAVASSVSVVSDVTGGINKIMTPLNKIKGVTDEIYGVLKKTIKIPLVGSFTVEQAIASTTGVVKKAAEALLNPVLKRLDIDIPQIPGIDKLDAIMDKVEGYYADIKSAADKVQGAANQVLDVPNRLRSEVDAIVAKAGCSL